MIYLFSNIDLQTSLILIIALIFVLFYEVINGFHDTANAVATVIYTKSIKSHSAVIIAGIFNFFGVLLGGLSVAYTIVHLIPIDLIINANTDIKYGLMMIFSVLFAAIIWNLSTWFFGLPASSSHTLIGAIIGVCITNALINRTSILDAINVSKMLEIIISLILSPIFGFIIAGFLIFFMRCLNINKYGVIHMTPYERKTITKKKKPPFWIRFFLIISSIGVSYSHGANDGQKGIGLIMLVLIIIIPSNFVVNINSSVYDIQRTKNAISYLHQYYKYNTSLKNNNFIDINNIRNEKKIFVNETSLFFCNKNQIISIITQAKNLIENINNFHNLSLFERKKIHSLLICISDVIDKTTKIKNLNKEEKVLLDNLKYDILYTIEYAPTWIIIAVALALSLGTLIGWKRIATTIGEKIGTKEITYAQGLSAQITSAMSIGIASYIGMPVSTPYILSSSLTGAIIIDGGSVQYRTIKNMLLAWLFTLPISIFLSGSLYWFCTKIV